MNQELKFSGSIVLLLGHNKKKVSLKYETAPIVLEFEKQMMNSFSQFGFSENEKQKLSRKHRKDLNSYLNINLFELNIDAKKLINSINQSDSKYFYIEANDYGAFVCLAAIYSGKLNPEIKIEFSLNKSPVALFPKTLLKKSPPKFHSITYNHNEDFWINHFETLYDNKSLNLNYKKSA